MDYLINHPVFDFILFQVVVLVIILSNISVLQRTRKQTPRSEYPMVSILVPARNEEKNIRQCIKSLLAQDYPSFEVLALDDQSSDGTAFILHQIAVSQPGLTVLTGSVVPEGRSGKNWACVQLAQEARGELLFFTDADTIHQPQSLRQAVKVMVGDQADLLTGFPRQQVHTWGERLLVPFFSWACLCFTPLWLAYRLHLPGLSNAIGQMMLFRRDAYFSIGGHESLGGAIVDDILLARKTIAAGLRWRVVNMVDLISCRMYQNSLEAYHGFEKNMFAAFDFSLFKSSFVFLWLGYLFWRPLFVLTAVILGQAPSSRINELTLCIGLALLLWIIPYYYLRIPVGLAFLYPVTILANEVVALQSICLSLTGRLTWKERYLERPRWKWF